MVGLEVPQSGVKKPRKPGGVRGVRIGGTAGGPDRWDATDDLKLKKGDSVTAVIKATEVLVAKP